jgi:hypothetical protein
MRRGRVKIIVKNLSRIILGISLAVAPATAQSAPNLRGTLTDTVGATIPGAFVAVHPDTLGEASSEKRETKTLFSDANGIFGLIVEPGFYDVCVMSPAFTPECRKMNVKVGQLVSPRFRLRVSPEVERLLADPVIE